MLALTRRVGEEIVIGDPKNPLGTIRIVEIHGDKVRLSFDFPRQTPINRKELAEVKAKHGDLSAQRRAAREAQEATSSLSGNSSGSPSQVIDPPSSQETA